MGNIRLDLITSAIIIVAAMTYQSFMLVLLEDSIYKLNYSIKTLIDVFSNIK